MGATATATWLLVLPAAAALTLGCPAARLRAVARSRVRLAAASDGAGAGLTISERLALRWRIAQLRSEIETCEAEADALSQRIGRPRTRPWYERSLSSFVSNNERTQRAEQAKFERLLEEFQQKKDPLEAAQFLAAEAGASASSTAGAIAGTFLSVFSNLTESEGVVAGRARRPQLASVAPGVFARAQELEPQVPGLCDFLEQYLPVFEPHLRQIDERLDGFEPHLPYLVAHGDTVVPHVAALLRHADVLLAYAEEHTGYWPEDVDCLAYVAPRLDAIAPHLPLLRPHVRTLLSRPGSVPVLLDGIETFVPHVAISANADVLLHYLGWALAVPLLRRALLLPGVPRLVALLARVLPKGPVRGSRSTRLDDPCGKWDECETSYETNALRYYGAPGDDPEVQASVRSALGPGAARRLLARARDEGFYGLARSIAEQGRPGYRDKLSQ